MRPDKANASRWRPERALQDVPTQIATQYNGARVAVACLKLAGNDYTKLKEYARLALIDYRDTLASAESARQ